MKKIIFLVFSIYLICLIDNLHGQEKNEKYLIKISAPKGKGFFIENINKIDTNYVLFNINITGIAYGSICIKNLDDYKVVDTLYSGNLDSGYYSFKYRIPKLVSKIEDRLIAYISIFSSFRKGELETVYESIVKLR